MATPALREWDRSEQGLFVTSRRYVEKPPHVDPRLVRHIADSDLYAAFGSQAMSDNSVVEMRRHRVSTRRPVWDPLRWAAGARQSTKDQAISAANSLLSRAVNFSEPPGGRAQAHGIHWLDWLTPLWKAYVLTHDSAYARRWNELFDEWYQSRDRAVGGYPGLDAIWYSLGVWARSRVTLTAFAAFADTPELTDEVWAQMLKTVLGGARWAAEEHDEFRHGNWQLVCCVELLHAAAMLPHCIESAGWIEVARQRVLDHLESDFYDDGGHYERAPSYHRLCVNELTRAAVIGEQYFDWPLAEHPRFKPMYDWLLAMTDQAGYVPPFQDSAPIRPAATLAAGHYLLGDPTYKWAATRWLTSPQLAEELGVLPPRPGRSDVAADFESGSAHPPPDGSRLLAPSGYAVMRTGYDTDAMTITVNYGPYVGHELESHSHNAALDFVMTGWGAPLAWEAGGPTSYDDPNYQTWYRHPRAHNVVVLAESEFSEDRQAHLELFESDANIDIFIGRHHGYPQTVRRSILFARSEPRYCLISDAVMGAGTAYWMLHSVMPWQPRGDRYVSQCGPGLVVIPIDAGRVKAAEFSHGPSVVPKLPQRTSPTTEVNRTREATSRLYDATIQQPWESGVVNTLQLSYETMKGPFSVLLVPFAREPAEISVRQDGKALTVTIASDDGTVVDRIGQTRWQRNAADGTTSTSEYRHKAVLAPGTQ